MTELKQFQKINGTYRPDASYNFAARPGSKECVGQYFHWEAMWQIEEGRYKGMWAMAPIYGPENHTLPFAWVPSCHIKFN